MSKNSTKKPPIHRTRRLKRSISLPVVIALSASVIILAGIIIAFLIMNKQPDPPEVAKHTGGETRQTESAGTVTEQATESDTEKKTEPPTESETIEEQSDAQDSPYLRKARELVAQMDIHKKICQLFITTPETLVNEVSSTAFPYVSQVGSTTQDSYTRYPIGGFLITSLSREDKPASDRTMLKSLCSGLQKLDASQTLLLCIDEDYLKELNLSDSAPSTGYSDAASSDLSEGTYTVDDSALNICDLNVVLSDCRTPDPNAANESRAILPSVQITDQDSKIDALNASGGFMADFNSIGQNGNGSYGSAAATSMAYRQSENNRALVVFEDEFYSVADTAAELREIRDDIRDKLKPLNPETVIISRIPASVQTSAENSSSAETAAAGTSQDAETLSPAVRSLLVGADILLVENGLVEACQSVSDALASGILTDSDIDDCVSRILAMKLKYFDTYMMEDLMPAQSETNSNPVDTDSLNNTAAGAQTESETVLLTESGTDSPNTPDIIPRDNTDGQSESTIQVTSDDNAAGAVSSSASDGKPTEAGAESETENPVGSANTGNTGADNPSPSSDN